MKALLWSVILILLLGGCSTTATTAQQTVSVKNVLDSQLYVFKAQSANPFTGGTQQLSAGYELTVTGDRVEAHLPYFGRADTPPLDPLAGGIKFSSQSFSYKMTARSNGGWNILIQPNDVPDVRDLELTVFDNGSATLLVNSTRRQAITFNGMIDSFRPKKKDS